MIKSPVSIGPGQTECEATKIMGENKYRRLPVVDESDNVIGVVSISDLSKHAESCPGCAHNILREFSH